MIVSCARMSDASVENVMGARQEMGGYSLGHEVVRVVGWWDDVFNRHKAGSSLLKLRHAWQQHIIVLHLSNTGLRTHLGGTPPALSKLNTQTSDTINSQPAR